MVLFPLHMHTLESQSSHGTRKCFLESRTSTQIGKRAYFRTIDSSKTVKPLFLVPFSKDTMFVDRIQVFQNLDEKIKAHRRVFLAGMGGVG